MMLNDMSKHISNWFDGSGPQADIVISSRIRLARNLARYRFLSRLTPESQADVLEKLKHAVMSVDMEEEVFFVDVQNISQTEKELLAERHLISRRHASGKGPRGVIIAVGESFSAMINEEDHLRMQSFKSGLQLKECWEQINRIDDMIEKRVEYAFSPKYGYLTACPTNVGTGIRVSVMLHLPALKMIGQIDKFFSSAKDMDLVVRGLFGEGTEAMGDVFQLSNQVTLGISESEIVEKFTSTIVPAIIDYEMLARQELGDKRSAMVDDKIQRALAVLRSARLISSQEALFLLGHVRMGVNLGRVKDISIQTVNELFMLTQPGHLQINKGQSLNPNSRDIARAEIIRKYLCQN
jgi:protein arginine kinase